MIESNDEDFVPILVCVSDSVEKGEYPTAEELDDIIHRFVKNEHSAGLDPKNLPLKDVIKVSNFAFYLLNTFTQRVKQLGYTGEFETNTDIIKKICKVLRKYQKVYEECPSWSFYYI